ncbi:MAG TPA: dihydrofolate reductase [Bacteroidales bacterium]|nr:dihydrofolate reductase [Bacteroidales bacterium]
MPVASHNIDSNQEAKKHEFNYVLEQFADLRILRFQVPGFENLSLKQKQLIYCLTEAGKYGRDILFDQNGKYNLIIRRMLENIYESFSGNRTTENWKQFEVYLKRIWFSNGIYHHYASDKLMPEFSEEYFNELVSASDKEGFAVIPGKNLEQTLAVIRPVIFDPNIFPKALCQEEGKDMIIHSAVNFYSENITQNEVEEYYSSSKNPDDRRPVSHGLNSKLVKKNGELAEHTWKIGGMYSKAIEKIVYWLQKAKDLAENEIQKESIAKLVEYYESGNLKTWDEYNVLWLQDVNAQVDFVNGFIENYADPMGLKATWESVVNFKDLEATKRTEIISSNAQWFEDNSPIDNRFKKKEVKGVSAKVITVASLGGDCYPATPIGINLPNADWIRKEHGSKSVTMQNITYAYNQADLSTDELEEFSYSQEEVDLVKKYGHLAHNLHVDLHECLGHGSGQLLPGVSSDALKNYASALEETRADLFALYFTMNSKMVELGVQPNLDVAKAEYITYIRNGLMTQLKRVEYGKNIEQAHMRNRQLIASWCYENGMAENVIEKVFRTGKTYFIINDFNKLHRLFGRLLNEVQRIKSEGDFEAGKQLVEKYAVQVNRDLHKEVLERYAKLNLAPYAGFVNPEFELVTQGDKVLDVKVSYVKSFAAQMLQYSKNYSSLPDVN